MTTHTVTRPTGTGDVTVSIEIDFEIPQKGDTLNIFGHEIVCTKNARLSLEFEYDEKKKKYTAKPLRTSDGRNLLVFGVDGYSWREGEYFKKAS